METKTFQWKWLAIYALVLNTIWEFGQCVFLFDMWSMGIVRGALLMWLAIFGDVVIVFGVVYVAAILSRVRHERRGDRIGWGSLLVVGFVFGKLASIRSVDMPDARSWPYYVELVGV